MTWGTIRSLLIRRADWREDVSAYLDDELSPRDRIRLEARLSESEEMQEYLADLQNMRSVLRRLEPAESSTPFQLTTEMLEDSTRMRVQPAGTARALRLSMSTAAVGVATFAAVMVFDAMDSPTVNFTTTSADVQTARVPTAAVTTEQVEVQTVSDEGAQVATDEAASASSSEPETVIALAQDAQEEEERATVAAVASEQEAQQAGAVDDAVEQAQEQEAAAQEAVEQEEAAHETEAYQEEQAQQQVQAMSADEAEADPSRRALTAGRRSGTSQAKSVNVEDVVEQQEQAEAAEATAEVSESATQEQAAEASAEQGSPEDSSAVESSASAASDDQQASAAETETRSVATSVARGESDWPLEQRPRSTTVRLARDPSWELPVQIVLAAVAISSAVFWLALTIVDRRRRA